MPDIAPCIWIVTQNEDPNAQGGTPLAAFSTKEAAEVYRSTIEQDQFGWPLAPKVYELRLDEQP